MGISSGIDAHPFFANVQPHDGLKNREGKDTEVFTLLFLLFKFYSLFNGSRPVPRPRGMHLRAMGAAPAARCTLVFGPHR